MNSVHAIFCAMATGASPGETKNIMIFYQFLAISEKRYEIWTVTRTQKGNHTWSIARWHCRWPVLEWPL